MIPLPGDNLHGQWETWSASGGEFPSTARFSDIFFFFQIADSDMYLQVQEDLETFLLLPNCSNTDVFFHQVTFHIQEGSFYNCIMPGGWLNTNSRDWYVVKYWLKTVKWGMPMLRKCGIFMGSDSASETPARGGQYLQSCHTRVTCNTFVYKRQRQNTETRSDRKQHTAKLENIFQLLYNRQIQGCVENNRGKVVTHV